MFEEMIGDIREETVRYCFNVTINTSTERKTVIKGGQGRKDEYKDTAASEAAQAQARMAQGGKLQGGHGQMPQQAPKPQDTRKPETFRREMPKVGRNDPCPCGSGKKYKNCCMNKDLEE